MRAIPVEATAHGTIEAIRPRTIAEYTAQFGLNLPGGLATSALALRRQLPNIPLALLTPAAFAALVMGLWRIAMDLNWAAMFPIGGGLFSHWQVWIALSIALKILSSSLLAWERRVR